MNFAKKKKNRDFAVPICTRRNPNKHVKEKADCKFFGTDLNRNWDIEFNHKESSDDPCADVYHGEKPFSEPETDNIRKYVTHIRDYVVSYVSLHAFSQLILLPW